MPRSARTVSRKSIEAKSDLLRDLFAIMDEAGTQEACAKTAGYPARTISAWRHARRSPTMRSVEDVAQALGYRIKLEQIVEPAP